MLDSFNPSVDTLYSLFQYSSSQKKIAIQEAENDTTDQHTTTGTAMMTKVEGRLSVNEVAVIDVPGPRERALQPLVLLGADPAARAL